MAVMVAATLFFTAATSFAQVVTTDKPGYVPGEAVVITGQGWQPQEEVTLTIGNAAGTRQPFEVKVLATANGSFTNGSFVVQESDRDQILTLLAHGSSGAEALMAFRNGVAPGSLSCSAQPKYDTTHFGVNQGQTVTCTIEGATDLSAAQKAGTDPVEVLVRSSRFGNQPATVLSVSGSTVTFQYTAPTNGCDTALVSYGPIRVCSPTSGQCTTLPTAGNNTNSYMLSGSYLAAGFIYMNGWRDVCCTAEKLRVQKLPQDGTFTQGSQATYTIIVSNPVAVGGSWANGVRLTDQLPGNGGMVWQYASASQGTCVNPIVNNMLDCTLGTIQPQKSVTVTVTSTNPTPAAACQPQPNPRAIATTSNGVTAYASGYLTCNPAPPQLRIVTTPDNGSFTKNSQVCFQMVVSNPGVSTAENVLMTAPLPGPGGLTWVSSTTTAGTCSVVNNVINCSFGDIAGGDDVTVRVCSTPTTPDAACTYLTTNAVATADGGLRAEDPGSQSCTTGLPPQLRVVKTPDAGTFQQGAQISYSITVSNAAAAGTAKNVQLTDQLPGNGGLTWLTAIPTQGGCTISSNNLNCMLGDLAAGASVNVVVTSTQTTPDEACLAQPNPLALATADGGYSAWDSGSLNCSPPAVPQLRVVKTPDNGIFTQGGAVSFTIVVSNPGTAPATSVFLTDTLPTNGGLTWTSYSTTLGSCSLNNNALTCSLGTIPAGGSVTVVVSSPPTTPDAACQPQPNYAAIATAAGGLTAQDSGSQTCTPLSPPQLRVIKTPDNGTFTQGGIVRYTIVVRNIAPAGSATARNVRLTDLLPVNGGLTWSSATTTQGSCTLTGNSLVCSLGDIPAGLAVTVRLASPNTTPNAACQSQPNPDAVATADGGFSARDSGSQSCTPPATASLGDRVWRDLNGNGIQDCQDTNNNGIIGDAGDTGAECSAGIPGMTVNLVDCLTPANILATTQTDANGFYLFQNLPAGQYCVRFNLSTVPAGTCGVGLPQFTSENTGANDALDSDANPITGIAPAVTLASGETNRTVDAGVICRTCAVAIDKTCLVQAPPTQTFVCSNAKPIDSISMIWTGQNGIYIKAWKGNPGSTLLAVKGPIATGDRVTITGMGGSPLDQVWELFSGQPDTAGSFKLGNSQFHISCSDVDMNGPEDCGKLEGNAKTTSTSLINLWQFDGMAGNGQVLACTPASQTGEDACAIAATPNPSCDSLNAKPKTLAFRYTGSDCSASRNNQAADKWFCSGVPGSNPFISIVKDPTKITVTPTSGFNVGDIITVSAIGADMGTEIQLQIGGQSVKIHTSCSQPLAVGDVFGSLELVQFNGQGAGAGVTYAYQVRNTGTEALDITSVADDKLGQLLTQTRTLAAGASFTIEKSAFISQTTTNVVTATARLAGTNTVCGEARDQVTVTVNPPTVPICQSGRPSALEFQYTGQSCAASNNDQAADKWSCSGDPAGAQPVTIVLMKDASLLTVSLKSDVNGNGMIDVGDTFEIRRIDGGDFNTETLFNIVMGGNILQALKIHTSCSQPLNIGDQFGSVIIKGFTP